MMVNVVSRSPFEYYPTVASPGGGISAAFQAGELTTEQIETNRATREREQALLPFKMQEYRTIDELRRQQMELAKAQEARLVADRERLGAAFGAAAANVPGAGAGGTSPAGSGLITSERAQAVRTQLMPEWKRLEEAFGLPTGYLDRTAAIESAYNPAAQRAGSQYVGLFQIGTAAARDLNLSIDPENDARRDPLRASEGAAQFAARNAQTLQRTLGRQPEGWELYLAHQQGAGGASALLANPQRSAIDALTAAYRGDRQRAEQAIIQNGGDLRMTAGQFAGLWRNKFGSGGEPAAPTAGLTTPAAGLATPSVPMFAQPGVPAFSTGGVPMTVSQADLPAGNAQYVQHVFQVPVPGQGMVPVAAPLDAQGRPVTPPTATGTPQERAAAQRMQALRAQQALPSYREAARQRVLTEVATSPEGRAATELMDQGRLQNNREMYMRGLAQFNALAEAANARLDTEDLQPQPSVVGASASASAPAPEEGPPYGFGARPLPMPPSMAMRAGAGTVPTPDTLAQAGIAPLGQAPGQAPTLGQLGIRPVGQQPARTPAQTQAPVSPATVNQAVTDATKLPPRYGVFDRSEVARERDTLNQQMTVLMNQRRIAIATRNAELLGKVDTALIAANTKGDMLSGMEAVASLDAGDPRPIADYFYRRTNGQMQLQQNLDGTFNVLANGAITQRNMSAAELARYARTDVDYRVRAAGEEQKKIQTARAQKFFETQLEILKESSKQEAIGTKEALVEKVKADIKARTGIDPTVKVENEVIYVVDPSGKRISAARFTTKDRNGATIPNNGRRLEVIESAYGLAVPTQ